jgi:outer membrane lipoprotein SlyB
MGIFSRVKKDKCPNCGKTVKETDKYCKSCGLSMEEMLKLDKEKKEMGKRKIEDEIKNGKEIVVRFPKIQQQTTNKVGVGAVSGGLLFGATGALVGGALGSTSKTNHETEVAGDFGKLKIAEKGLVITHDKETLKIAWDNIKSMSNRKLVMGEGQNIIFYSVEHFKIVTSIVNDKACFQEEDGW